MIFLGEIIALITSVLWTCSSISAEISSKRIGVMPLNIFTMAVAIILLGITLLIFTGLPYPQYLNFKVLSWIIVSGCMGYVICNYFLFNAYLYISSRFGQLFMTISAPSAAITGWILLDEKLNFQECLGIVITLSGIALSILSGNKSSHKIGIKLPVKGVIYAVIAGLAQGIGLVFGKVGMIHYQESIPAAEKVLNDFIPMSASFLRVLTGLIGFFIIILIKRQLPDIKKSIHNKKGMLTALLTTMTGPFLGATCALIAMRYSKAGIAATLLELSPIFIILPAHIIFKQKIRLIEVIGAIISVGGVSLFFIKF